MLAVKISNLGVRTYETKGIGSGKSARDSSKYIGVSSIIKKWSYRALEGAKTPVLKGRKKTEETKEQEVVRRGGR